MNMLLVLWCVPCSLVTGCHAFKEYLDAGVCILARLHILHGDGLSKLVSWHPSLVGHCNKYNVCSQAKAQEEGLVFVAPYDDPHTIAGQGTIGTEVLRQLSSADLDGLHAIFVAIGGGGLIAGIAAYVKALRPGVKIIGVEPTGVFFFFLGAWKPFQVAPWSGQVMCRVRL